ncbi:uncharacterized protein LOC111881782 [Lactuca sativa]|uniref:Uncharacterized protein n=1 Tax=Lactuca sativa TaxID=4236 RepID=A0A9R1UUY9_LACSA|nr:uncharacterized protein LOC111881782 [Lactuca sativa]KAJ0194251.1 hypothetical protein LSAT_V11C800434560 [Lactuca sativa]
MNAVSNSERNFNEENAGGSDTDTIPDESPEYYEPISSSAIEDDDSSDQNSDTDHELNFHRLPNGEARCVQNGINSLDLSDEDDEEDEHEEEERMREAMQRAFREDESRRRAPLTPENTTRVMEAMRGISFPGMAPDWAGRVPEDRWIDQLTGIRQPPSSTAS